jgi:hypothetical protein
MTIIRWGRRYPECRLYAYEGEQSEQLSELQAHNNPHTPYDDSILREYSRRKILNAIDAINVKNGDAPCNKERTASEILELIRNRKRRIE